MAPIKISRQPNPKHPSYLNGLPTLYMYVCMYVHVHVHVHAPVHMHADAHVQCRRTGLAAYSADAKVIILTNHKRN